MSGGTFSLLGVGNITSFHNTNSNLAASVIPVQIPIPISNHSTPKIFHGIGGGDPASGVFTSGVLIGQGKTCTDLNGRNIPSGVHYVPGPDECTLCVCEDGETKWCKAVLCSPPQDCKSFRVGSSCCDFICLDDSLNKGNGGKTGGPFNGPLDLADVVPKIIVVAITAILSLSLLLFLIHRLRQKQIQGRLNSSVARRRCDECDDSRSLDFSMDYFDRGPPPPQYLAWWKPQSSYFPPRGEAPPPYEEAIASTSNCLPMTFTNAYSNNNTINNGTHVNGISNGIATTSLITTESAPINHDLTTTSISSPATGDNSIKASEQGHNNQTVSSSPKPPLKVINEVGVNKNGEKINKSASLSNKNAISGRPKRYHSLGSSGSSSEPQPGPSSRSTFRINETENSERNGLVAIAPNSRVVLPTSAINESRFPLRDFMIPPPYDDAVLLQYGKEYFRHSLTLPRRVDYLDRAINNGYCPSSGGNNNISHTRSQQQRFSLQFNVADHWSSASSSTLSLSTPNSPNGLGRPPSLSSSSSSNVSNTHV